MSGAAAARALEARFDSIMKSELSRLHRKVSRLDADHHVDVAAITAEVIRAIARQPARVLARQEEPALVRAVVDLFDVSSARAPIERSAGAGCDRAARPNG